MTTGQPYQPPFSVQVSIDNQRQTIAVQPAQGRLQVLLCNQSFDVDLAKISENGYSLILNGHSYHVLISAVNETLQVLVDGICFEASIQDPKRFRSDESGFDNSMGPSSVLAPMPGKVVRLLVGLGDSVKEGQGVVVVEAMKMQNELKATKAGKVERMNVVENQTVNAGDSLLVVQ